MTATAKPKIPCDQQDPVTITDECVRTYKCPQASKPKSGTLVGILFEGELIATVLVESGGEFKGVESSLWSGLKRAYFGNLATPSNLSYRVSFDGVESERCDFAFQFDPRPPQSKLVVVASEKNSALDLSVARPSEDHTKLFGRSHSLCKKKSCDDEADWKKSTLYAVTDLNKNQKKEYWYFFADGYRKSYRGEEYDPKKNEWTTIFSF